MYMYVCSCVHSYLIHLHYDKLGRTGIDTCIDFDSEWKEEVEHEVFMIAWHVKMNTWIGKYRRGK